MWGKHTSHFCLPVREELKQLKTLEDDLCVEIKDAERTVALTEEKCAAMTHGVPEMMELEAKERDRVSRVVRVFSLQGNQL